jgi:SAM-dependent methyltransferase
VITVEERYADDPQRHHYTFRSGRITHGKQYYATEKRAIPLTYYGRHTGVGRALAAAGERGPLHVAVVGLGTGTLATYARSGDHYRFYEINPAVVGVAHKWFTFLADCRGTVEVVEGDARLVLEREKEPRFDVIVLDAFSGDTVPVHLLTQEAFAIYRRRLRDGGLIAVNVDNDHLQLPSEVQRQADAQSLGHTRLFDPGDGEFHYRTDWILISGDQRFLQRFPAEVPTELLAREAQIRTLPLWTDHYSNLASLLINR